MAIWKHIKPCNTYPYIHQNETESHSLNGNSNEKEEERRKPATVYFHSCVLYIDSSTHQTHNRLESIININVKKASNKRIQNITTRIWLYLCVVYIHRLWNVCNHNNVYFTGGRVNNVKLPIFMKPECIQIMNKNNNNNTITKLHTARINEPTAYFIYLTNLEKWISSVIYHMYVWHAAIITLIWSKHNNNYKWNPGLLPFFFVYCFQWAPSTW